MFAIHVIIIVCNHVLDPNGSVTVSLQRFLGPPDSCDLLERMVESVEAFCRGPDSVFPRTSYKHIAR
jgi:hypothetical protein